MNPHDLGTAPPPRVDPPERAPGVPPRNGARAATWAAVAFVAAFALRLPFANAGLLHHDEVQLARAVERSLAEGRLVPAVKGRYGAVLLGVALEIPHRLLGGRSAERVVLLLGILGGALLVAFLLMLVHELTRGDLLASGLAAAFAGTGTVFLTSSSTGKENVPQLALVVAASWLVARGARTDSLAARVAALALFGLALTIHEGGILLVPPLAAFIAALHRAYRRTWSALLLDLALLAAATAAALGISIWEEILRNTQIVGSNSASFLGLLSPMLPAALRDAPPALGAATLVLAAVGLYRAARMRDVAFLGIAPWLLVFLYFGNVSSYGPRYLLYVVPPVAVLAATGAAWLVRLPAARRTQWAVATLLVAAAAVPGVVRAAPLLAARAVHSGPKAMALLVKQQTEPDAIIVCMDDAPFIEYYAGRRTLTHPVDDPMAMAAFVHDLKERVRAGARVYVGSYAYSYDPVEHFKDLMDAAFVRVPVGQVVNEWYYRHELEDVTFDDVLYRLELR